MLAKNKRVVGYRLLVNWWLLFHAVVSVLLTFGLVSNGFEFASKALFPAASVLVGMAFAWTTRASTILNNKEFRREVITDENPLVDYVYGFQLSVLILFLCIIYLAIMAAGGFSFVVYSREFSQKSSTFFMFMLISMTVRECWAVINFTNLLTLLDDQTGDRARER